MSTDLQVSEQIKVSLEPPKLWKVLMLNDDQTPMEFVIELLTGLFKHTDADARALTLEIHNTGSAVVAVHPYEIAEQRALEATKLSRSNGFPLRTELEQE